MTVRVRFAPSPTGYLHVGGARTALYNRTFSEGRGQLILRSDDTDRARSTEEFAEDILESMRWLGVSWDEGVAVGGPHGTYRQSDRLERYRDVADDLVVRGLAYHSFATSDQLDAFRKEAQDAGRPPAYDGRFRVGEEESAQRLASGEMAPIRFAVPRPGSTEFVDTIRGDMSFEHSQVDDFVILRSDRSPTYHLASTVDDVDYGITHVIRGEDLLSSTPKHILLTDAVGAARPSYAHLPLLMGPDGAKLSKRHGHTAVNAYRRAGYLPEALLNYLAILSWSPGDDEEIVTLDDMVPRFRLEDVSRNPAVFDVTKLEWMNGVYIRELSAEDFVERSLGFVEEEMGRALAADERATFAAIAPLVQERAKTLVEVGPQLRFLFTDEIEYDESSWQKVMTRPEAALAVSEAIRRLDELSSWTTETIETSLRSMLEAHQLSARKGLQPIRVAVCGSSISPPLFESLEALGRERSMQRLADVDRRLSS